MDSCIKATNFNCNPQHLVFGTETLSIVRYSVIRLSFILLPFFLSDRIWWSKRKSYCEAGCMELTVVSFDDIGYKSIREMQFSADSSTCQKNTSIKMQINQHIHTHMVSLVCISIILLVVNMSYESDILRNLSGNVMAVLQQAFIYSTTSNKIEFQTRQ